MPKLSRSHLALICLTGAAWLFQLLYMVMPIDFIPDLVPLLGWIDDLIGLTGTLSLTGFTAKQLYDAGHFTPPERDALEYEPIDPLTLKAL